MSHPPRLTLIRNAQDGSYTHMRCLAGYAFHNPEYLPESLEAVLAFLDPAKIPKTFNKRIMEPFQSALWALIGLSRLGMIDLPLSQEHRQRALAVLKGPWAGIWQWVDYITDKCFLHPMIDGDNHLKEAVIAVFGILGVLELAPSLCIPAAVTTVYGLWRRFSLDRPFRERLLALGALCSPARTITKLLSMYFIGFPDVVEGFEPIISTHGPEHFASIALGNLKYEMDRIKSGHPLRLSPMGTDCMLFKYFDDAPFIFRNAFMSLDCTRLMISAISFIGSLDNCNAEDGQSAQGFCIALFCAEVLEYQFCSARGLTYIRHAVQHDLILALLTCQTWISWAERDDPHLRDKHEMTVEALMLYLQNRMIYRKVFIEVKNWMPTKEAELSSVIRSITEGNLRDRYISITGAVAKWPAHDATLSCTSIACANSVLSPKKCSGCSMAVYCSRACQRRDWRYEGHRENCKLLRAHRIDGLWKGMSVHDYAFFRHVVNHKLNENALALSEALSSSEALDLPPEGTTVGVSINFTSPYEVSVVRDIPVSGARYLRHVRESQGQLVPVRAWFQAGRTDESILLLWVRELGSNSSGQGACPMKIETPMLGN